MYFNYLFKKLHIKLTPGPNLIKRLGAYLGAYLGAQLH